MCLKVHVGVSLEFVRGRLCVCVCVCVCQWERGIRRRTGGVGWGVREGGGAKAASREGKLRGTVGKRERERKGVRAGEEKRGLPL